MSSSSAKKSSMKGPKPPHVQAYQSLYNPERVITNPMEVTVFEEDTQNVIDRDYRLIPEPGPKKVHIHRKSTVRNFYANNNPNTVNPANNVRIPTNKLVGYTTKGKPVYWLNTNRVRQRKYSNKHPNSNPKLKKTHVHVHSHHTTEDPMEEAVYGDNNAGYVAVYHPANQPPINNNKPSGGKASGGAPRRRGILKSGTKKAKRVALDPQTISREFERNNAPEMVRLKDIRNNSIRRTEFGP